MRGIKDRCCKSQESRCVLWYDQKFLDGLIHEEARCYTRCHLEEVGPQSAVEADEAFVADNLAQSIECTVIFVPKGPRAHTRNLHLPSKDVKGVCQRL